jgi:hypothetical protein
VGTNQPATDTDAVRPQQQAMYTMIEKDNNNEQDKFIAIDSDSTTITSTSIYQKLAEIFDKVDCLQRAVARICGQQSDFRVEYSEDIAEVKRQIHELRRNKVWFPRESV